MNDVPKVSLGPPDIIGPTDIKGQNNLRQIAFGIAVGVVTGAIASLGFFAGNMQLFADSLPPIVLAGLSYGAVALYNAARGKPIKEIASDMVDSVLGEEEDRQDE